MLGYRLYYLDEDGRVAAAAESECPTDAAARLWAFTQLDNRSAELWSGTRVLAKFERPLAGYRTLDRVRDQSRRDRPTPRQAL